ncbi:DUF4265 domain-containing protein [Burkholderia metallica]|uniref:DUF4265 domain-containing protein n=1 Tax=Burkholderia metallica TaxID=488729 RepID=A0ABT8PCS6_9BURK|nr:DUF4265 domain-containing protein [Burkholderia metallica]AOJ34270.1 hypothetical protein WJ16_21980 [Burkholderia metallica]MDN7932465.1 DUF4265 domain-containing protein [Burkholderia metallica]
MDAEKKRCLVNVYAGHNDAGPVYEELPAMSLGDGSYELLSSPGLALNLAKGDLIKIADIDQPATILKRGGNFCVQIYADEVPRLEVERLEREVCQKLGGSLDGMNGGNLALSVPSINGIEAINRFFDDFKRRTGIEWYYANVYKNFEDSSDDTLLNWWVKE